MKKILTLLFILSAILSFGQPMGGSRPIITSTEYLIARGLSGNNDRVAIIKPDGSVNYVKPGNNNDILTDSLNVPVWKPLATANNYKGTYDATTNTPPLIDGTGTIGWWYRVVASGTQNFGSGNISFNIGDDVYYNGSIWQRVPGVGYTLQPATASVLGGVKIGSGVNVTIDGTISVNTSYIPTSHTTYNIANGTGRLRNNGTGVWSYDNSVYATESWVSSNFDNYQAWFLKTNGSLYASIDALDYLNFQNGSGINWTPSGSNPNIQLAANLDIIGLSTIANPSLSGFLPYTTSGTNTKITLNTLQYTIGSEAGSGTNLNIIRNSSGDAYAHNFILSSDRRLKKNIVDLQNTEWANKIKFKQFQFKDDPKEKIRYGVIAQDIEKIAPQLVSTDADGNKAVAYIDLLIAKVDELQKQVKELQENQFILSGKLELLEMKLNKKK